MKQVINYILLISFSLILFSVRGQAVIDDGLQLDSLENFTSLDLKALNYRLQKLNYTIDSLEVLHLPTDKYKGKLDSLSLKLKQKGRYRKIDSASGQWKKQGLNVADSLQTKLTRKEEVLQQAIHKKTSFADSLSLQFKDPVSDKELNFASDKINANGIDNKDISRVASTTKDLDVPKIEVPGEMKNINAETSNLTQLPKSKVNELAVSKELGDIGKETQQISSVTGKIETYNQDIKNLSKDDIKKVEALPKDIENAAMARSEVQGLSNEVKEAEATKNILKQYKDELTKINKGNAEKLLKNSGVNVPDYFSSNEAALQAGVKTLEKLKRKYGSIPDSRYLPKRAPSVMKGKPLIERIVPGINFQFFQQNGLTITDLSPFAMYSFTSRLRMGVGGTYRLQFNSKVQPVHVHDAFGFRAMADYKVLSGFSLHAESEWMKIVPYNPITSVNLTDSESMQWVPGLYLGILKQYKAGGRINGNFQVLYNFAYHRNGVYPNKINIRFGFEFPLKKKKKN